jgi:glycerophosphoryl diester phosphodiesterase
MNDGFSGGKRTIDEFYNRGIEFSVYNVDTDQQMNYYVNRADKLKCICSNYPKKLLSKMRK